MNHPFPSEEPQPKRLVYPEKKISPLIEIFDSSLLSFEDFCCNAPIPFKICICVKELIFLLGSDCLNAPPFDIFKLYDSPTYYYDLDNLLVTNLLCCNNSKIPTKSELALNYRDQSLLNVICLLTNGAMTSNTKTASTFGAFRPDLAVGFDGYPPGVLCEEKVANQISEAIEDLKKKFYKGPMFSANLPWIIGIAISGNLVHIGKLNERNFESLAVFNLDPCEKSYYLNQLILLFRALINIARWLSYAKSKSMFLASGLKFFSWENNNIDHKLLLTFQNVKKGYLKNDSTVAQLTIFYDKAQDIPYLEKWNRSIETRVFSDVEYSIFTLSPVGVTRVPNSVEELKRCLSCLGTCVKALHKLGYAHNDIRWPNVIWCIENDWYLIDCEFCLPFGSKIKEIFNLPPYKTDSCIENDLLNIKRLVYSLNDNRIIGLPDFQNEFQMLNHENPEAFWKTFDEIMP